MTAKAASSVAIASGPSVTSSQTPTGVVLKGQGAVKPDLTTPSGLVGRVTIQMEKMQEALAQAQQDPGKAQGVLGLMLLQGLGRADQETTRFVLDLTPDGQTLLNGQDFSAVTKMFKGMGGGNPLGGGALPVTPVPAAPPVQQEL